jgi:nucleoid DNA-binding protein
MPTIEKNLDRSEIVAEVAKTLSLSEDQVDEVLDRFIYYLRDGIAMQKYVEIHRLGSFSLKVREAKRGVTPGGKSYAVGKRYTVNFNAGKEMRDTVEEITGLPCIP